MQEFTSCCPDMHQAHTLGTHLQENAHRLSFLQDLLNRLGSGNLHMEGGFPDMDADVRSNYVMNTTLLGTEASDNILLVGSNPRVEAPVFNAR